MPQQMCSVHLKSLEKKDRERERERERKRVTACVFVCE